MEPSQIRFLFLKVLLKDKRYHGDNKKAMTFQTSIYDAVMFHMLDVTKIVYELSLTMKF